MRRQVHRKCVSSSNDGDGDHGGPAGRWTFISTNNDLSGRGKYRAEAYRITRSIGILGSKLASFDNPHVQVSHGLNEIIIVIILDSRSEISLHDISDLELRRGHRAEVLRLLGGLIFWTWTRRRLGLLFGGRLRLRLLRWWRRWLGIFIPHLQTAQSRQNQLASEFHTLIHQHQHHSRSPILTSFHTSSLASSFSLLLSPRQCSSISS